MNRFERLPRALIIRRVGGLEDTTDDVSMTKCIIRRVGGLEGRVHRCLCAGKVIRRVGGSSPRTWGGFDRFLSEHLLESLSSLAESLPDRHNPAMLLLACARVMSAR